MPISRVTADVSPGRILLAKQEREISKDFSNRTENSSSPPALSCRGKLRRGQKSELITGVEVSTAFECPSVDAVVLDSAAILNMLPPRKA